MTARTIALGELEKLRKRLQTLKAQAQNYSSVIEIRNAGALLDPLKLDGDAILQAAKDLKAVLDEAREKQAQHDQLYASLYDE